MCKLVLLSDQIIGKTKEVDNELIKILNNQNPKIAYIPSVNDKTRKYYNQKLEYYRSLGINNLMYFDIGEEYDETNIKELLECDAIHLSGGDTVNFLKNIKRRKFYEVLYKFVCKGGILIGISAGAILMSKDIDIVLINQEKDDNLTDTRGLGMVDFDIMPHWGRADYSLDDVISYSIKKRRNVYLCKDGEGVIVNEGKINVIGSVIQLFYGNIIEN